MLLSSPTLNVDEPSNAVVTFTITCSGLLVELKSPSVCVPPLYVALALNVCASVPELSLVLINVRCPVAVGLSCLAM